MMGNYYSAWVNFITNHLIVLKLGNVISVHGGVTEEAACNVTVIIDADYRLGH